MVKKVGKYEIGKTLGEGTFGKVKYAVNTETDERVAIKVLDKEKIQKQNMGAQIKKEISIMKMVRHKHVVVLREVLASRTKIFIVLELVTGGELFDKIVSEGRFNDETARFYFRQLLDGVDYCHKQGVCHRDLKPENLLLDENGDLKISDFGLSALYEGSVEEGGSRANLLHTTCGTPNYVAPEVLADKGYDGRAADVWSMGVILYVLLAGFLPFDEPTMSALFRKIQKAEFSYPSWFSPQVRDLLNHVLVADPAKRWKLDDIRKHPWYTAGGVETTPAQAPAQAPATDVEPSAEDIEDAIQEGAEEMGEERKEGPKSLNAFDLINRCAGTALSRMFQSNDEKKVRKSTQFTTSMSGPKIVQLLKEYLESKGCEITVFDNSTFKIKATLNTPKGAVGVSIQVYTLAQDLQLVEVRRGKGDIFEYYKLYSEIMEHLSNITQTQSMQIS